MTTRISLIAVVVTAALWCCDTERNIAPVYETYFTKYYGEDGNQVGVDLVVGADGTMVMVGTSQSQTSSITRGFIVKVDAQGTVLWKRQMGGDNEVPVDVELDSRNDILVVSNLSPTGSAAASASIRITRISQSGSGIDSLTITDENNIDLFGTSVTEINDGNLIVTGYAGPGLVEEGSDLPPPDFQDLVIIKVDPNFNIAPELKAGQGGEHTGKIVKLFESQEPGEQRFYTFGDSDRQLFGGQGFKQAFEVLQWNEFFISTTTGTSIPGDVQFSSEAIAMPIAMQRGYLMVGSTGPETFRQIFVAQYTDGRPEPTVRFSKVISTSRSAEGVSVAYGEQESMFVLADERQDNNNHDIYLVKLGSDGRLVGSMRFGSIEGDDHAAAVRVLPDQRVAVFGTIELATQKKMMLTLVSPMGTFSE